MIVKNGDLQGVQQGLIGSKDDAGLIKERLPFSTAMKIRALIRLIEARLQDVEAERLKLIELNKKMPANGKGEATTDWDACNAQFNELLLVDFEIDDKFIVRAIELSGVLISPICLLRLGDLVNDVEPETLTPVS